MDQATRSDLDDLRRGHAELAEKLAELYRQITATAEHLGRHINANFLDHEKTRVALEDIRHSINTPNWRKRR